MNLSYRIGWTVFRALYATYFRWRVFGMENVPLSGGVMVFVDQTAKDFFTTNQVRGRR